MAQHKTVRKNFRVSPEEDSFIRSQCEQYGMNESTYLRYLLKQASDSPGERAQPRELYLVIKDLTNAVNSIGVNINQIVRNVNMQKYSDFEKKKLFALMEEIKKTIREFQKWQ